MRAALLLLIATTPLLAQTVHLRDRATGATSIAARVGDTLSVEIAVDLGALTVSGLAVHLSLPAQGLAFASTGERAVRPFQPHGLFEGGVEFVNARVPDEETFGLPAGTALLTYAVVLGPGTPEQRSRSGSGSVATIDLVCTGRLEAGRIRVFSNPIHQSMVVLSDGRSGRAFRPSAPLELTVRDPAARPSSGSWAAVKSQHADDGS